MHSSSYISKICTFYRNVKFPLISTIKIAFMKAFTIVTITKKRGKMFGAQHNTLVLLQLLPVFVQCGVLFLSFFFGGGSNLDQNLAFIHSNQQGGRELFSWLRAKGISTGVDG